MLDLIFLILYTVLIILSLKNQVSKLQKYHSLFNIELILLVLATSSWMVAGEIELFWVSISDQAQKVIGDLVFILIIIVYLRLSYIFSKFVFSKALKFSTQTAIIGLSILIGLRFANLIVGESILFAAPGQPVIFPIISLFILIAHLSASIIFLQANYFFYQRMHDTIEEQMERITNATLLFVIVSMVAVAIYSVQSFNNPVWAVNFLPFLRLSVGLAIFSIINYIGENPTILLTNKVNIDLLLDNGYIGFTLVSVKDSGPTTLATSDPFDLRYDINLMNRELFASTKITVIGIGDSFKDSIFSIPYPQKDEVNAISLSFSFSDKELKDPRMKQIGNAIYSILIPNNLSPLMSINFDIFPFFKSYIESKQDLEEISNEIFLRKLTKELLTRLI